MVDKYGQDGFYVHFPLPSTHARRGVTPGLGGKRWRRRRKEAALHLMDSRD